MRDYAGLARSLVIYHGQPQRRRAKNTFYQQFIKPGDLCFDIGAHTGGDLRTWLGLGARVLAVEPQPRFMRLLQRLYRTNSNVTLIDKAIGAGLGETTLYVNMDSPAMTTLSRTWMDSIVQADPTAAVRWDRSQKVQVTTLDRLIGIHECPKFCKIDVEGMEADVLKGLSTPVPMLSFAYLPTALDIAILCLENIKDIDDYRFNATLGEQWRFLFPEWISGAQVFDWITHRKASDDAGDIYCRRQV